ncbi:MAG: hypothetical protein RLY87_1989 [Chloroflexota bacterium]|jgi:hypothetical protein
MTRTVIIHYHLFKNAGSTVDHILERECAGHFGQIEGEHPWSVLGDDEMTTYLDAHPHIHCVTSHQATLYTQVPAHLQVFPIMFLRHPIDRAHSVYEYEKRQTGSTSHGSRKAKELDFDAYVQWRLSPEGGAVIRNFQSRCVSGRRNPALAQQMNDQQMQRISRERIATMEFIGIVERFDDSVRLMQRYLEAFRPGMNYHYERVNSSAGRASTIEERLAVIQNQLSAPTYDLLLQHNRIDLEIYEVALQHFDSLLKR